MDTIFANQSTSSPATSTPPPSRRGSLHISRKTSWGTPIPPPSSQTHSAYHTPDRAFEDVELNLEANSLTSDKDEVWNTLDNIAALGLCLTADEPGSYDTIKRDRFCLEELEPLPKVSFGEETRPFNKWVKNLQRRGGARRQTVSCDTTRSTLQKELLETPPTQKRSGHKKSLSGSSFGFVTAVKSASISLASLSIAPRSRRTGVSSRQQRAERSSKASNLGRHSEDSSYIARSAVIDQAVTNRLIQRRRILEELINTEESYVADVKFLMNVYVTLLASIPTLSLNLRASINRNLNEIVELHEELLGELHRVVPHSEYMSVEIDESRKPVRPKGHHRWRSLDAVPERLEQTAWLQRIPGMTAEPKVAAEVAKVFGKRMNRFFVYEEYGAKYELMIKDVASTYRTIPQWEVYQKGLEALASSLASINSQIDTAKKSLTIGDLLVKPIQRVCKYPLLFDQLLKQTPVCDCPLSHLEIENVLVRLREATNEINQATDDPKMKAILEKTWLLQDRLVFPKQSEARSTNAVRGLGHVHVCGVLHASWQTKDGVDGQYLICILYRDYLVLALAAKAEQTYAIQACIGLSGLRVEEVDNGRGLQCHTAPFSWKLVFEFDHQLFEITMSACSPKEELEWRSRLKDQFCKEVFGAADQAVFESQSLDIKPLGTVFGKPGTIARRIAIHRATTIGSMSGLCQVIIRNTNSAKEASHPMSSASINRSQSLLTTNRVPILAPARTERVRLEAILAEVWTRDILPYPGMSGRVRSEILTRASASSIMRKLSVASIASNFTKRSGSMASLRKAAEDESTGETDNSKHTTSHFEPMSPETKHLLDLDDASTSRLSVIQDEKETYPREGFERLDSFDKRPGTPLSSNASSISTMRRLATLKVKKSWGLDGQRIITPPLRTSSANSVTQTRTTNLTTIAGANAEEKENVPHVTSPGLSSPTSPHSAGPKQGKRVKVLGKNRAVVAEGIRNFFR